MQFENYQLLPLTNFLQKIRKSKMDKFNEQKKALLSEKYQQAFAQCFLCDDKKIGDGCITNCTKELKFVTI